MSLYTVHATVKPSLYLWRAVCVYVWNVESCLFGGNA